MVNYKRWMVATALVATIILGAWTYLVLSYDSPLGTDNTVVVQQSSSTSNGLDDYLATLTFGEGAEDLEWSSLAIEIEPSGDVTKWNATESISLKEQDINICGQDCNLTLLITYETVHVKVEYTSDSVGEE